jgi:hypothetical protein
VLVVQLPPPFTGVRIAAQKLRASRTGVIRVKVSCPAATVGSCIGTLTLTRSGGRKLGKATFAIAPGLTGRVSVKLSKTALKALRKAGQTKATATAVAHDVNASRKTTAGKLTLLAPH